MLTLLAVLGLAASGLALRGDNALSPATTFSAERSESADFGVLAQDQPADAVIAGANLAAATALNLGAIPPLPAGPRPFPHLPLAPNVPRLPFPAPALRGAVPFAGPFRVGPRPFVRPFVRAACPPPPPNPTRKVKDLTCTPIRNHIGCIYDFNCIKVEEPVVICPSAPEKPRRSQNCNWVAILDKDNCIVDYECEPKAPEECKNEPIRPDDTPFCKFTPIKSAAGCVMKFECEPNLPLILQRRAALLPVGLRRPVLPVRQLGPVLPSAALPLGGFRTAFPAPLRAAPLRPFAARPLRAAVSAPTALNALQRQLLG